MQPSGNDDLDRTDELPRLDVAAYEASFASGTGEHETLSNTDTWAVQSVDSEPAEDNRDKTLINESPFRARAKAIRQQQQSRQSDVTLDADRILTRIAQVESELAAVKGQNTELRLSRDALQTDLAQRERDIRSLSVDNERLSEQRGLIQEKALQLEQELARTKSEASQVIGDLRTSAATN